MNYDMNNTGSSTYEEVKYLVGIISSSVSLIVILSLYILYFMRPRSTENVFFRMVVYMELPNAIYAITGLIIYPEQIGHTYCILSGAIRQFANLSSSFWTLAIAFHINSSISDHKIRPFSNMYFVFGYGLALPFAFIPLILKMYEITPIYCGLPFEKFNQNLIVYYIPILTILITTCYYYYSVINYLWRSVSKEAAQEFYALFLYPFLVVLYNIGSFIFLVEEASGTDMTPRLQILVIICTGILQSQGIFDVLVYSMNYAIRKDIKLKLCSRKTGEFESDFDPNFSFYIAKSELANRRYSTSAYADCKHTNIKYYSFDEERSRTSITV